MSYKNDKIKKLAGSVLSRYEAEPPADMWSRIQMQMRRKKRLFLLRVMAMAASVLLLLGVGFSLLMPGNDQKLKSEGLSDSKKTESANPTKRTRKQSTSDFNGLSGAGRAERPSNTSPAKQVVNINDITIKQSDEKFIPTGADPMPESDHEQKDIQSFEPEFTTVTIPGDVSVKHVDEDTNETDIVNTQESSNDVIINLTTLKPDDPVKPLKAATENTWSLAMGYGTTSASETMQQDASLKSSGSNYSYDGLTAELANETSYFEEVENISHDAPLSLGFIISYQFGKRWYAETGLLYTRLGYQVKTYERNNLYYQYGNELYYLGVPLGIRCAIMERKRFGIFATQSVIIEKGIKSSNYTYTYTQGVLSGSENNEAGIRGIQLSSLAGIGADVKIAGKMSAYGQAGIQVFMLNSTQPYNIRSARVAWPSFQVGLRMKLE